MNKDSFQSCDGLSLWRLPLLFCLFATGIIGGYFSYTILNDEEMRVEKLSFISLTDHMERYSMESMVTKVSALHSLRSLLLTRCPYPSNWPNCTVDIDEYNIFAYSLVAMADIRTCNHEPKVLPSQMESFVAFAEEFYTSSGYTDAAMSVRENGIFAVNHTTSSVYTVTNYYPFGKNELILPIVQIANPSINKDALMFNIYSEKERVWTIDRIYDCVRKYDSNGSESITSIGEKCMGISRVVQLIEDANFRPAAVLLYPLMLPVDNTSVIAPDVASSSIIVTIKGQQYLHVGSMSAVFNWGVMFTKSVLSSTNGLNVVLSDGEGSYCYTFVNGNAVYKGKGCRIEDKYEEDMVEFPVSLGSSNFTYTIKVYRDDIYSNTFHTNNPIYTCVITVAMIIACAIQFVGYDTVVFKRTKEIDSAKRNFVRYISHEIRTPLTTVSLGIKLVSRELQVLNPETDAASKRQGTTTPVDTADSLGGKMKDVIDMLECVDSSTDAAILILNDLLQYDHIKFGHMKIQKEMIAIVQLFLDTARLFDVQAREAGVDLVFDCETDSTDASLERVPVNQGPFSELTAAVTAVLTSSHSSVHPFSNGGCTSLDVIPNEDMTNLCVLGDSRKLSQVLRNLISNALKFTQRGGNVIISVKWNQNSIHRYSIDSKCKDTYVESGSVVLTVRDNGIGLSRECIRSVFNEGWQYAANALQAVQGSGLGLWIAKNIVEHHNGTISCESEGSGFGSSFIVELPVYVSQSNSTTPSTYKCRSVSRDASPGAALTSRHQEASNSNALPLCSDAANIKTVLVVDDSPMCRKMVCRLLRSAGYICFQAVDGKDCIEKVIQHANMDSQIDMIILDYEMPVMNGPVASKILRAQGCLLPIVGLTGNVLEADTILFLEHGANAVIHKPFTIEELNRVIRVLEVDRKV